MNEGIIFGAGCVFGGICSFIGALIKARVDAKAEEKRELDARTWAMSSDIATLINRVNRLEGR